MTTPTTPSHADLPAGAYRDLVRRVLPQARAQRPWQPEDGPMPALFVSHGIPPFLESTPWLEALFGWAQDMPKPRAVLVVSAHWEDAPLALTSAAAGTPLHFDFDGSFPQYRTLRYPTPAADALAERIAATLGRSNPLHVHTDRGLDHGAFIPLMAMYPAADIPVVQLSMPSQDPAALLALGRRLRDLRDEGVLVVGSGFMTHSFAVMHDPRLAGHVQAFDEWGADALARRDVDALLDYRRKGPGAAVAHVTADHFAPLFLALGAADDPAPVSTPVEGIGMGNSIRSIQLA